MCGTVHYLLAGPYCYAGIFARIGKTYSERVALASLNIPALNRLMEYEILNAEVSIEPQIPSHNQFVGIDFHTLSRFTIYD